MNIHPAIARLSEGANLQKQIVADRPALVAAALLGGATVSEIVVVLGGELDELRMAVRRWVPQLQQAGQLTKDQGSVLLTIVFESAGQ